MTTLGERIRKARAAAGLSQSELAQKFKITRNAVGLWEAGTNAPTADRIGDIANALGVRAEWLMTGRGESQTVSLLVPVAGYVGAGAEVHPFDDYPKGSGIEMVPAPPGEINCVGLKIRGDSMHPFQEGWLVFYRRDRDGVPENAIGKLSVVKIKDGPTLVKMLRRGTNKNRWNLESWNAAPREGVALEWAAKVIDIRPT